MKACRQSSRKLFQVCALPEQCCHFLWLPLVSAARDMESLQAPRAHEKRKRDVRHHQRERGRDQRRRKRRRAARVFGSPHLLPPRLGAREVVQHCFYPGDAIARRAFKLFFGLGRNHGVFTRHHSGGFRLNLCVFHVQEDQQDSIVQSDERSGRRRFADATHGIGG